MQSTHWDFFGLTRLCPTSPLNTIQSLAYTRKSPVGPCLWSAVFLTLRGESACGLATHTVSVLTTMNRSNAVRKSKPIACTNRLPAQTPYGRRLLPRALDEIARSNPNRLYATIPHGIDLSQGFRDINFREMATGINFVAHWIHKNFGCSSNFEPLCYIGIPDLRSVAVFLAGVKCGYKVSKMFCKPSQSP